MTFSSMSRSKTTRSSKKMVLLSAVLALPPLALATALIDNPAPRPDRVPAVAGYNEPPADAKAKPKSLAQLFAALRSDDSRAH